MSTAVDSHVTRTQSALSQPSREIVRPNSDLFAAHASGAQSSLPFPPLLY